MQNPFVAFQVAAHAVAHAPSTLNGSGGLIDVTNVTSFVDPVALVALNAARQFDLRYNIAYNIYCGQGRPDQPTAVTADHLQAASRNIARSYERFAILDMLSHSDYPKAIIYRSLDIVLPAQLDTIPGIAELLAVADLVHERFIDDPVFRAKVAPEGHLAMTATVANALHRVATTGHNWFTDAAGRRGTPTNRLLSTAGADRDIFEDFMAREGHDIWHFLSDATLADIASAVTGESEIKLNAGYEYRESEVSDGNMTISEVIQISQAAKDRWPVGTVGISALILAIPLIRDMITQLAVRSGHPIDSNTDKLLGKITSALSKSGVDRDTVLELRDVLQELAAIAYGFNEGLYTSDDSNRNYTSLSTYVSRDQVGRLHGKMIGNWAKSTAIQDASIAGIIGDILAKANSRAEVAGEVIADDSESEDDDDDDNDGPHDGGDHVEDDDNPEGGDY